MTEAEFFQMAKDMGVIFHTQQISSGGILRTGYFIDKEKAELWADYECMKADYALLKEKVTDNKQQARRYS